MDATSSRFDYLIFEIGEVFLYHVFFLRIFDGQTGEVEVDAEGNITEPLKWDTKDSIAP